MSKRTLNINKDQRGITGLETPIILIAFVVVASVFAYTVMSAGIFSAQTGKKTIHSGLEGAQSSMELSGAVVALDTANATYGYTVDGKVDRIIFTITNSVGGEAINFTPSIDTNSDGLFSDAAVKNNVTVISYIDKNQRVTDLAWSMVYVGKNDGNTLLNPDERMEITLELKGLAAPFLIANGDFSLEVKPPKGNVLYIERRIPAVVDPVMNLR